VHNGSLNNEKFFSDGNIIGKEEGLGFSEGDETYVLRFQGYGNGATWYWEDWVMISLLEP